jgi:hypothetical protein
MTCFGEYRMRLSWFAADRPGCHNDKIRRTLTLAHSTMKICPQGDIGYPDNAVTCPTHGGLLSEILDLRPGMLVRKTYRIERLLDSGYFLLAAHYRLGRRH